MTKGVEEHWFRDAQFKILCNFSYKTLTSFK